MRRRIYYSTEQRREIWDRWKRGESAHEIGRLFDRPHSSIFKILMKTGGLRPPERRRSRSSLTLAEREEISRGLVAGLSIRSIAADLKRAASTISREIKRNGGRRRYRAVRADKQAWAQALRPKPCKLLLDARLRQAVIIKLQRYWSPQQIAGWLKRSYPGQEDMHISHETIYKTLYVQARGALKKELIQYLREKRRLRRSRYAKQKTDKRGQIKDAISISERPAEVEDRAVPGHSKKLPTELYKSLTWDRGKELADHKRFTLKTNIDVFFCDPQSPWQRGSNENTNRLLRQYFPKGTDLSVHSQAKLNAVARSLNERPRKTLEYETPAERFGQCVAMTD